MSRPAGSKARPKPHSSLSRRRAPRGRIASLLMLTAILGAIALGLALLIFILRDLWVFIVTMTQPG